MEVDFVHENVPANVPPDTALCLFRVVQEGLRNAKKHSGASQASVRIECSGVNLHVTVHDRGKGFDLDSRPETGGIGIWSMQERVRLLGGRLQMQSRVMQGTRIDAWLPVNTDNTGPNEDN